MADMCALWDQYHEGQRVVVVAADRAEPSRTRNIPGVFAVRSNHLWRRRVADETPTSIENLWIDIGARSRADAQRMGVDVLDPVVRDWPEWTFGDFVAGPAAGNRAGCAALAGVAASNNRPGVGETVLIIATQKSFSWAGLTSAIARLGRVDTLAIVDADLGGDEVRGAPDSGAVARDERPEHRRDARDWSSDALRRHAHGNGEGTRHRGAAR